jgi:hypothetical protein
VISGSDHHIKSPQRIKQVRYVSERRFQLELGRNVWRKFSNAFNYSSHAARVDANIRREQTHAVTVAKEPNRKFGVSRYVSLVHCLI